MHVNFRKERITKEFFGYRPISETNTTENKLKPYLKRRRFNLRIFRSTVVAFWEYNNAYYLLLASPKRVGARVRNPVAEQHGSIRKIKADIHMSSVVSQSKLIHIYLKKSSTSPTHYSGKNEAHFQHSL